MVGQEGLQLTLLAVWRRCLYRWATAPKLKCTKRITPLVCCSFCFAMHEVTLTPFGPLYSTLYIYLVADAGVAPAPKVYETSDLTVCPVCYILKKVVVVKQNLFTRRLHYLICLPLTKGHQRLLFLYKNPSDTKSTTLVLTLGIEPSSTIYKTVAPSSMLKYF